MTVELFFSAVFVWALISIAAFVLLWCVQGLMAWMRRKAGKE